MQRLPHHCNSTARHTEENQLQKNKCEHQQEQLRERGQRKASDGWPLFKKYTGKEMEREGGRQPERDHGTSNTPAQGQAHVFPLASKTEFNR